MQQFRIGRALSTTVLALSAMAMSACLGDSDPVELEVTDGDLIGVAIRMNEQHFTLATFAEDSGNADLLALADSMAAHHHAQFAAFDSLGITARETDLSQGLRFQTSDIANRLAVYTGVDFDQQLVDEVIDVHEQNILIIDDTLLPEVENADLDAELRALRAILVADLFEFEALQAEIGAPAA